MCQSGDRACAVHGGARAAAVLFPAHVAPVRAGDRAARRGRGAPCAQDLPKVSGKPAKTKKARLLWAVFFSSGYYTLRSTLPERRPARAHEHGLGRAVHHHANLLRVGSQMRRVAFLECATWLPDMTPFPQTSQIFPIVQTPPSGGKCSSKQMYFSMKPPRLQGLFAKLTKCGGSAIDAAAKVWHTEGAPKGRPSLFLRGNRSFEGGARLPLFQEGEMLDDLFGQQRNHTAL